MKAGRDLRKFWLRLAFFEPNARTVAVFGYEYDTCALKGGAHGRQIVIDRVTAPFFEVSNSGQADTGVLSQFVLCPVKEAACCATLFSRNHAWINSADP